MLGLGLSIPQVAARGSRSLVAAIRSLFAANEPGVWYDPSDLSTMFQDAAGTTPVTAVEQPVGLMLDKSKGLVLGPELATGWLDNGASWTAAAPAFLQNNGVSANTLTLELVQVYGGTARAYREITGALGKTYLVTQTVAATTATGTVPYGIQARTSADVLISQHLITGSGSRRLIFTATSATVRVTFTVDGTNETVGDKFYLSNISVREIPGNHAYQTTATSRPVLRQDGNGKHYLYFDGVDDWLVTNTITPGIDKVQVFAGVRKLSDAAGAVAFEMSSSFANNQTWGVFAPNSAAGNYAFGSSGTLSGVAFTQNNFAAPITNTLTGIGDISGDSAILRINGVQTAQSTADQGSGNYLAYPLYIGRRGGSEYPFNGHIYSLIVRFGSNLPAATIEKTEKYINTKTRAY